MRPNRAPRGGFGEQGGEQNGNWGRDEAFTSVSCCFLSPPFQRISSRLPSSGHLVGPGRAAASCASPCSIMGQRGTSRGRRGAHAVDVTGLGGCPRLRSSCRKAARERLLPMGELMAAGETRRLGMCGGWEGRGG